MQLFAISPVAVDKDTSFWGVGVAERVLAGSGLCLTRCPAGFSWHLVFFHKRCFTDGLQNFGILALR